MVIMATFASETLLTSIISLSLSEFAMSVQHAHVELTLLHIWKPRTDRKDLSSARVLESAPEQSQPTQHLPRSTHSLLASSAPDCASTWRRRWRACPARPAVCSARARGCRWGCTSFSRKIGALRGHRTQPAARFSKISTAGSTLPSRYSRNAPPAVEMYETLS